MARGQMWGKPNFKTLTIPEILHSYHTQRFILVGGLISELNSHNKPD